jgi:hypothetical protein
MVPVAEEIKERKGVRVLAVFNFYLSIFITFVIFAGMKDCPKRISYPCREARPNLLVEVHLLKSDYRGQDQKETELSSCCD